MLIKVADIAQFWSVKIAIFVLMSCFYGAALGSNDQSASTRLPDSKSMVVGENILRYIDKGFGQPLIFLHGWSSSKSYWHAQLESFAKTHRVILLDWRGQGESSGAHSPYSFSALIDDLKVFIDKLALDQKPVLIGHSMGGVQVMHFASTYPEVSAAIVSVDAPGRDNFITGRLMYWSMLTAFKLTGFLSDENAIALHIPVNRLLFYAPEFVNENPSHITQWEQQFTSNNVDSLINSLKALTYRERLSDPVEGLPALFVLGGKDRFISPQQTRDYQSFFSGAELKTIPGAGHMSSEENPDLFNDFLHSFLLELPPRLGARE